MVVNDLKGTDVDDVDVDLGAIGGGGDTQADTVVVNGTNKRDVLDVTAAGSQVLVQGLAARTRIAGSEVADTLLIQTLDGKDAVTVAPAVSALITPIVDLGAGQ